MRTLKIDQLQYESDSWKRQLTFMAEENIRLKNRLSEILRLKVDDNFLAKAETFQNDFIRQDDLVQLVRTDIADFDRLLKRELIEDGALIDMVKIKYSNTREIIKRAEKQFESLRSSFNLYILENT